MEELMEDFTIENLRDFMNNIENINKLYSGCGFIQNEVQKTREGVYNKKYRKMFM